MKHIKYILSGIPYVTMVVAFVGGIYLLISGNWLGIVMLVIFYSWLAGYFND